MANPYYALFRIRRARRSLPAPPAPRFDRHRDEYRRVLEAVHDLAGEDAVDDLSGWIIVQAAHDDALPVPAEVRRRARSLLRIYDAELPADSPLAG